MKADLTRPTGAGTHGGRLLAGVLAVMLTAAGGYCWLGRHVQPGPLGVVIVTLDMTRADRLSAYGYMDVSLPALDRLAAEGIVFGQATSVGALTRPAHASLFTGLLPPAHGIRENADPPLATSHVTLAELLKDHGFRTSAFVGSVVLNAGRGLAQGFDHYSDVGARDGEATRWLEGVGDDTLGIQNRALTSRGGMNFPIPRTASPSSMRGRDRARLSWRTRPVPAGDPL